MEAIFEIIGQDLEVAVKAAEADDYNIIRIVGNRIMMNLFITEEVKLMLLGYMVRELGGELRTIKRNNKDSYEDLKKESIAYLKDLETLIASEKTDPKIYWEKFIDTEIKLRKYLLDEYDNSVYDDQAEFAKGFSLKLLDAFYSLKKDIPTLKNHVLMMTFELSRNFNQHSGKEALIIYLVFRALMEYYSFYVIQAENPISKNRTKRSEEKLIEYVDKIYELKTSISNIDELYIKSNDIIDALGRDTRLYYLSYGGREEKVEQKLELPEDAKQKIGETIMQSLQNANKKITEG